MTIENSLDRIAAALERLAGDANAAPKEPQSPKEPATPTATATVAETATSKEATPAASASPSKRAEDRVPKDPPKRQSRQIGTPAKSTAAPATEAAAAPALTLDDVRAALVSVQIKTGNKDKVYALLGNYKATSLGSLKPADFGKIIDEAKAFAAA